MILCCFWFFVKGGIAAGGKILMRGVGALPLAALAARVCFCWAYGFFGWLVGALAPCCRSGASAPVGCGFYVFYRVLVFFGAGARQRPGRFFCVGVVVCSSVMARGLLHVLPRIFCAVSSVGLAGISFLSPLSVSVFFFCFTICVLSTDVLLQSRHLNRLHPAGVDPFGVVLGEPQ